MTVSGYVPYSGSTGPLGVQTGLVYLPSTGIKALSSLDPASISQALSDPDKWTKALLPDVQASLSTLGGVAATAAGLGLVRATARMRGPVRHGRSKSRRTY